MPTLSPMKTIKSKIKKIIQESNGYPNYSQRVYIDTIRLILNEEITKKELKYIHSKNINLDLWIMDLTEEVTRDLF